MQIERNLLPKLWLFFFIISCIALFLLIILFPHYLRANINEVQIWHQRFYQVIYSGIRVVYVAPIITFLCCIFYSYPILKTKKKEVLLFCVTFILCLLLAEIILRAKGFRPGYTGKHPFFTTVDSLYEISDYHWDKQGIVHFTETMRAQVNEIVDSAQKIKDKNELLKYIEDNDSFDYCGWLLVHDFGAIFTNGSGSVLKEFIDSLKQKNSLDDGDSAVLEYVRNPINKEGFKSIPFKKYNSKKKKILLIGDSFTYGMSASPVYNSYADLLLSKGYLVWNPSFPNNDPESYLQIAKKYVPVLKPDVVIVCFYMGNDIMMYERNTVPGKQHFFPTNAGWIKGEENGCYFDSAEDAYHYYLARAYIGQKELITNLCSKTSLSTLVYFYLNGIVSKSSDNIVTNSTDISYSKIRNLITICEEHNILYYNLILPDLVHQNPSVRNIKPKYILKEIPFKEINGLNDDDYVKSINDGHFNNKGHKKAAQTINDLIK